MIHLALAMVLSPLLFVKVLIARYYKPYYSLLTPIGLVKRAMGWDPLQRRSKARDTFWQPYPERPPRHYEKMF